MGIQYVKCVYKCVRAGNILDVGKVLCIATTKKFGKINFWLIEIQIFKFALQSSPRLHMVKQKYRDQSWRSVEWKKSNMQIANHFQFLNRCILRST